MASRFVVALVTAAALALSAPSAVPAQDKAGVVTTLHGTATVARATLAQPAPLKFRDAVYVNDRITTGEQSIARILLGGRAIVTVRERSILTINEVPGGVSTVDVGTGGIALAVVKERMKPGESIEIRTPNAVAGIRGTVVVADVSPVAGGAPDSPDAFTTTITVLTGAIVFGTRDPLTGALGASVSLTAMQQSVVTGRSAPRTPVTLPTQTLRSLTTEYKLPVKDAPPVANEPVIRAQMAPAMELAARLLEAAEPQGGKPDATTSLESAKPEPTTTDASVVKGAPSPTSASVSAPKAVGGGGAAQPLGGTLKVGGSPTTTAVPSQILRPTLIPRLTVEELRSQTPVKVLPLP